MTGAEFIQYVKAKLNRLDTAAYADVRDEEILFFGHNAHKVLLLLWDTGQKTITTDSASINNYMASQTISVPELLLVDNAVSLPKMLKFKDMMVYVEVEDEFGWQPTIEKANNLSSQVEENYFTRSQAYEPTYRLINDKIKFEVTDFLCKKIKYEYIKYPEEFTEASTLDFPFIIDLQDKTVTLILENLEQARLQSQPAVTNL